MTKELFKRWNKWTCEGWIDLGPNHIGLGISTYHYKGTHNFEFSLPFFNLYISFWKSKF